MGFLDRLLGRTAPPTPNLDALFAVPNAALTLEAALGFRPSGVGAVCFRAAEGAAFSDTSDEIRALLDADGGPAVERSTDEFGFTWLTCRTDDVAALTTELHAVNSTLHDRGFGPALLCSTVGFANEAGQRLALVYLYKRGTFYPFAPALGGQGRDNALELQVRAALASDLSVEAELTRWFAVWGVPM